jgi:hypothetical protein
MYTSNALVLFVSWLHAQWEVRMGILFEPFAKIHGVDAPLWPYLGDITEHRAGQETIYIAFLPYRYTNCK